MGLLQSSRQRISWGPQKGGAPEFHRAVVGGPPETWELIDTEAAAATNGGAAVLLLVLLLAAAAAAAVVREKGAANVEI